MRAFLALPVDEPAATEVAALRAWLGAQLPTVRWSSSSSPHLTVHFFGEIAPADAAAAVERLRPLVTRRRPFSLRLRRLGCFGRPSAPRVLWVGPAEVDGEVRDLVTAVHGELRALGHAVEERGLRLHCTLGRPAPGWTAETARTWRRIADRSDIDVAVAVDRLVLYESAGVPVRHVPRAHLCLAGG